MFLLFNLVYSNLIELTTNNSVILRGPVNSISVSKWIYNINKIKTDDIYIYIKSPGGSVTSGNLFIEQIKSLSESGKNIHCIAEFAASMAFIILQSCPNRYGLFSSILMQHQISFGISGNLQNVNKEYQSDQFTFYGEYYFLGGWFSIIFIFLTAFFFQRQIQYAENYSKLTSKIYKGIVLYFFWIFIDSFGIDWLIQTLITIYLTYWFFKKFIISKEIVLSLKK